MIAIIDANTLSCLGLVNLIQELIPQAPIRTFGSFKELVMDTPDLYAHYFVAAGIFFEHTAFFLERKQKTIVLTNSDNQPQLAAMRTLNVCLDEPHLAKSILQMHHHGHHEGGPERPGYPSPSSMQQFPNEHELSAREIEVLTYIARGYINKEIADKLHISLTTVISHRKNITEKIGIKSVAGLTIYAVMHGYVEADSI